MTGRITRRLVAVYYKFERTPALAPQAGRAVGPG